MHNNMGIQYAIYYRRQLLRLRYRRVIIVRGGSVHTATVVLYYDVNRIH